MKMVLTNPTDLPPRDGVPKTFREKVPLTRSPGVYLTIHNDVRETPTEAVASCWRTLQSTSPCEFQHASTAPCTTRVDSRSSTPTNGKAVPNTSLGGTQKEGLFDVDDLFYAEGPVDLKLGIIQAFNDMRCTLAEQITETLYLRQLLHNKPVEQLNVSKKPVILSGQAITDAFSTIWEENRNLRFLLRQSQIRQSPTALVHPDDAPGEVSCHCMNILRSGFAMFETLLSNEAQHWLNRCLLTDRARQRLSVKVLRLTDRLNHLNALILQDPILSGAFHYQMQQLSSGDIITRMHEAYAQLSATQVINEDLEEELQREKAMNQKLRQQMKALQQQMKQYWDDLDQHVQASFSMTTQPPSCFLTSDVNRNRQCPETCHGNPRDHVDFPTRAFNCYNQVPEALCFFDLEANLDGNIL